MSGILAIDPASRCGFCFLRPGAEPVYGSHKIAPSGADHGVVSHRFRVWLGGKVLEHKPSWIVFEAPYIPMPRNQVVRRRIGGQFEHLDGSPVISSGPAPMNFDTIYRLCGLCFVIEGIAAEFDIPCRKIDTSTWTKGFTGQARYKGGREAKKEAVMGACKLRGWDISDSDAADAVGIAVYAESVIAPRAAAQRRIGGRLFA